MKVSIALFPASFVQFYPKTKKPNLVPTRQPEGELEFSMGEDTLVVLRADGTWFAAMNVETHPK
jgi:hypothetical protein